MFFNNLSYFILLYYVYGMQILISKLTVLILLKHKTKYMHWIQYWFFRFHRKTNNITDIRITCLMIIWIDFRKAIRNQLFRSNETIIRIDCGIEYCFAQPPNGYRLLDGNFRIRLDNSDVNIPRIHAMTLAWHSTINFSRVPTIRKEYNAIGNDRELSPAAYPPKLIRRTPRNNAGHGQEVGQPL